MFPNHQKLTLVFRETHFTSLWSSRSRSRASRQEASIKFVDYGQKRFLRALQKGRTSSRSTLTKPRMCHRFVPFPRAPESISITIMANQVFHLCKKRRKRDRPRQRESKNHNISVLFINGDESIYSNSDFFGMRPMKKLCTESGYSFLLILFQKILFSANCNEFLADVGAGTCSLLLL
jgi:hypothetical protein